MNLALLLSTIIKDPTLHARWLNTLSYLENCGARMIAACEHPTLVRIEMLKHAAEEFRHSHYLKTQIQRICSNPPKAYTFPTLLGGFSSLHYLRSLDLQTCRYLKAKGVCEIRPYAYLLVTYAIELRAEKLYPLYHELLKEQRSPITVKSILLEEKEHLAEMREGLAKLSHGFFHASHICAVEEDLYTSWVGSVSHSVDGISGREISAPRGSVRSSRDTLASCSA